MDKREIPIKNYIILAFLILGTVFLTFKLANVYKAENAYYKNESPLHGVLYEIKPEELDNYLLDNPNIVIYVVDGNEVDGVDMDNKIKEIVLEYDLTDDLLVIDITADLKSVTPKLNDLLNKELAKYKSNLLDETNLFIIRDRVIDDILTPKTMDEEAIISFLIKNGVM